MNVHGVLLRVTNRTTMEIPDRMGAEIDAECNRMVLNLLVEVTAKRLVGISSEFVVEKNSLLLRRRFCMVKVVMTFNYLKKEDNLMVANELKVWAT